MSPVYDVPMYDVLFFDSIGGPYQKVMRHGVGGSERALLRLAQDLTTEGLRVGIVSTFPKSPEGEPPERVELLSTGEVSGILRCKTLVVQRYSRVPANLFEPERVVVWAHDRYTNHYDEVFALFPNAVLVCLSKWQQSTFPAHRPSRVIPAMLPAVVHEQRPYPIQRRKFIYPSAAVKGLHETVSLWQEFRTRYPDLADACLYVISSGYDSPDEIVGKDSSIIVTPVLNDVELDRHIATSEGLFVVNTFPETFGLTAAMAEARGVRTHILCRNGKGALEDTVRSPLVTEDPKDFEEKFIQALGLRHPRSHPFANNPRFYSLPRDYSNATLLPQWIDLLINPEVPEVPVPHSFHVARSYQDFHSLNFALEHARVLGDTTAVLHLERLHTRGMAYGQGYGTHLPLLAAIVALSKEGPILELGSGHFSTMLLGAMGAAMGRTVHTVDCNRAWLETFDDLKNPRHHHHLVEDRWHGWSGIIDRLTELEKHWSVVFIDQQPDQTRLESLEQIRPFADYILIHDSCNTFYGAVEEVLNSFAYRFDYTNITPVTTVVSDTHPFPFT